jgi:uncharacterized protein YndB with AHSA1/START domain
VAAEPLVREIVINAPPEAVFEFLVDPVKMMRWMGAHVELDPRPGGIVRIDPNGKDFARGTVVEVVPNTKLSFTWGWEGGGHRAPPGSTLVEIHLVPEGALTRVRLVHRELPANTRDDHDRGWTHYLARLKTAAEGGEPGPDPLAAPSTRGG